MAELDDKTLENAAYHEAGHVVVAVVLGLRIDHKGMWITGDGKGESFYERATRDGIANDHLLCKTIISLHAGLIAQKKFNEDSSDAWASNDSDYVKELLNRRHQNDVDEKVRCSEESIVVANRMVEDNWGAIKILVEALLRRDLSGKSNRSPGDKWKLSGEEIQIALKECRVPPVKLCGKRHAD